MFKYFLYLFYINLKLLNNFFLRLFKKSFLNYLYELIREDSYKTVHFENKKIIFFIPSLLSRWRVETLFSKEPETIKWINTFKNNKNIIFWDIGANIGLYSLYCSIKKNKISVICFEPSPNNLVLLTRNISINKLHNIEVFPMPICSKKIAHMNFYENSLKEGSALNSYSQSIKVINLNRFKLPGFSIDYLLFNKIYGIPDYIKIDVDGIEREILIGGEKTFYNKKIKSVLVEIDKNISNNNKFIISFFEKRNFFYNKKIYYNLNDKNQKTYNMIFYRK